MTTTDDASRTGSFGPAMQVYGLVLNCYISLGTLHQVEQVFGEDSVLGANQYHHVLVKLHSHNAMHVLAAKLPELCTRLNVDRIDVLDMSDWTVREFVLHPQKEE